MNKLGPIGRIMFENYRSSKPTSREALRLAAMKLPVICRFVERGGWQASTLAWVRCRPT